MNQENSPRWPLFFWYIWAWLFNHGYLIKF